MNKKKINLVWLTTRGSQTTFEKEYIVNRVFGEFECIQHQTEDLMHDNAVLIFSCNTEDPSEDFWKVINWYKASKYSYFLYHLSDERCAFNPKHYEGAKWIWRNYGHSKYDSVKNLTVVPLGFQSGFLNQNRELNTERNIDVAFAGSMKQDRAQLVDSIKALDNHLVKVTTHFNDPAGIPVGGMRDIYHQTFLVPCPMGWAHPDSFRVMEALEWGAIPIIKMQHEAYFQKLYPMNPFLVVRTWDELQAYVNELSHSKRVCLKNAFNWYSWYIKRLKIEVKAKYESLL